MLMLSSNLRNRRVLSLRTGGQIAIAVAPVLDPDNLKIIGWWCNVPQSGNQVLLYDDVREVTIDGLIVNDQTDMAKPDELVRYQNILNSRFELIDKVVKTKRNKVGKVSDYAYNDGLFVQKLYVARSLMNVLSSNDTAIIDRSQIIEITDDYILVRDTDVSVSDSQPAEAAATA